MRKVRDIGQLEQENAELWDLLQKREQDGAELADALEQKDRALQEAMQKTANLQGQGEAERRRPSNRSWENPDFRLSVLAVVVALGIFLVSSVPAIASAAKFFFWSLGGFIFVEWCEAQYRTVGVGQIVLKSLLFWLPIYTGTKIIELVTTEPAIVASVVPLLALVLARSKASDWIAEALDEIFGPAIDWLKQGF